jgi:hypothetical protein
MEPKPVVPIQAAASLLKHGSLKMIMSITTELCKADMYGFITLVSATRKLQKQYYSTHDKSLKQELLIKCKQHELRVEKLGNELWKKYKLYSWK